MTPCSCYVGRLGGYDDHVVTPNVEHTPDGVQLAYGPRVPLLIFGGPVTPGIGRVSKCLVSAVVAPNGNPTTEQTLTPLPCRLGAGRHPGGVHADAGKASISGLATQRFDLIASRIRLQQCVIHHPGHAGRRSTRGVHTQPLGTGGDDIAEPLRTALVHQRVTGATRRGRRTPGDDSSSTIIWIQMLRSTGCISSWRGVRDRGILARRRMYRASRMGVSMKVSTMATASSRLTSVDPRASTFAPLC